MKNQIQIFYILLLILASFACNQKTTLSKENVRNFNEPHRPQFHFSPPSGWMNDPNGMVYLDGEYHLFYQHYPDGNVWGPMHWGHAISEDMIHWEHQPIALFPDEHGTIFSGSAVADVNNTSNLGTAENPPLVAIFTYHNEKAQQEGRLDYQTQGIAYSLDKGCVWTKYKNNPVLTNPGILDFRDPKVFWNEKASKWTMILAVKDHVNLYSSPDLIDWKFESDFGHNIGAHGGVWECPDLFPLVDETGKTHWVMLVSINPGGPQGGSATQYFVGKFDGSEFVPYDLKTRWVDHGADNYAGVTWSNIPKEDSRRLFLGWMSNWQYANQVPTYEWRSAMTIPRELTLEYLNNEPLLISSPVSEIKALENAPIEFSQSTELTNSLFKIDLISTGEPFELFLSNELNEKLVISFTGTQLTIDRSQSGKTDFSDVFSAVHTVDMTAITLDTIEIYVDRSSLELLTLCQWRASGDDRVGFSK